MRKRERERKRGEREKEKVRKRENLFLKGMTGALAPFNYLVVIELLVIKKGKRRSPCCHLRESHGAKFRRNGSTFIPVNFNPSTHLRVRLGTAFLPCVFVVREIAFLYRRVAFTCQIWQCDFVVN